MTLLVSVLSIIGAKAQSTPDTMFVIQTKSDTIAGTVFTYKETVRYPVEKVDSVSFTNPGGYCPDDHHPHAIDLGLDFLVSCCNVGATSPGQVGTYFAWGETSPKATYTQENSLTYGKNIPDWQGDATYDAATANWGSKWMTPTKAEIATLVKNVTFTDLTEKTSPYGWRGWKLTSKVPGYTNVSIFIPSSCTINGSNPTNIGIRCFMSSTSSDSLKAYSFLIQGVRNGSKYLGEPVRPITKKDYAVAEGYCPDSHHPHLIDLGLPSGTKWACCNIGATTPEGYGGYFNWGKTVDADNYDYYDGTGSIQGDKDHDAAAAKWGGSWVMPTTDQLKELFTQCGIVVWGQLNGINGYRITSALPGPANGNKIFLPAAGYRYGSEFLVDNQGYYWSSTPDGNSNESAYELYFNDSTKSYEDNASRDAGCSVRPCYVEK